MRVAAVSTIFCLARLNLRAAPSTMTTILKKPRVTPDEQKWAAVVARDGAFDGHFVYSVASTGVYCRPSCASRLAKRSNVAFHPNAAAAESKGFRPCKRCQPNGKSRPEAHRDTILEACRLIELSEAAPSLAALAQTANLSPYHFHRLFKSVTGVTPKAYAMAHRHERVRSQLKKPQKITDALYEAGFNSSSRFYDQTKDAIGMTPSEYRRGGANMEIRVSVVTCSLGSVLVAATKKGVCAVLLGDDPKSLRKDLRERFPEAEPIGGDPAFAALVAKVVEKIERPSRKVALPLDVQGTAFQHRVWQELRNIPAGETASYAEISERIGRPTAVRAVASACGANPAAVLIPCHRAIRSDGSLSGYRWGVERKKALLKREKKT